MAREQVIEVPDLTGGLNRHASAALMGKSQARRLRNVDVSDPGAWKPRPGRTIWGVTNTSGGNIKHGMARIYLQGVDPFMLFAIGRDVYTVGDDGTADAEVVSTLHLSNDYFFPHDAELVAVLDGSAVPQKSTDGTTWTQLGITPPAAAPTAAALAGGSLVNGNTYEFSYAYADEAGLATTSNESATVQQAVAGANLSVRVTVTFSADPQVDQIYVYARDVTAGEGVRRFAGQVANPGSGTATVDVTTNNWSSEEAGPTRRTVPPALAFALPFKGRWWGWDAANPRVLRFSELFGNQYWPVTYAIEMPFVRGDRIRAAAIDGDVLVVFGLSQAFVLIAQTAVDFEVRPTRATSGAFGPRAVSTLQSGGIAHAAPAGVFALAGETDTLLSTGFEREWREMIATASIASVARIPVCYHARDKELRIGVPLLPPYGDPGEYVLNLERPEVGAKPAWTTTDASVSCYMVWDGPEIVAGNHGRIFVFNDQVSNIVREESVGTQGTGGGDLTADYEGPALIAKAGRESRFPLLCLDFEPNAGTFGVEVRVDGLSITTIDVPIGEALSRYGTAVYGTGVYGGQTRDTRCFDLPVSANGESIQLVAQYQGQAPFQWFGYRVTAIPEPAIRGL